MLDLTVERTISLQDAARLLPPGRNARPVHISAIVRWITSGAKAPGGQRVRLEAIRIGGRWLTSREALQRFGERLTPREGEDGCAVSSRTPEQRRRAAFAAAKQLEAAGM